MESIKIVFTCDDLYAMPLCVALTSLKKNKELGSVYNIYIVYDNLKNYSKQQICKLEEYDFQIEFLKNDFGDKLNSINSKAILEKEIAANKVAMTKFFMSDIFKNIDKVLYLDCDILILKDLKNFYEQNIENYYAAVIPELDIGEFDYMKRLGINHRHYFNSGVMLLNLKKMREDNISSQLVDYRINGLNYYMDQDAFNVVFKDNVIYLGYEYNCLCKHYEQLLSEEKMLKKNGRYADIYILHFAFKFKPWIYMMPNVSDVFLEYYQISPYKDIYLYLAPYEMDHNYIFPFSDIRKGSNIIIYGAGRLGKMYKGQVEATNYCNIIKWIDKNYKVLSMEGNKIESLNGIDECDYDYIVIAIAFHNPAKEIKEQLIRRGVNDKKIIWNPIKLSR